MTAPLEAPACRRRAPVPRPSPTCARTIRAPRSRCGSGGWPPRPEAVAFRLLRQGRLAGDDLPRGRRAPRARSPPAWSRAGVVPGDRVCLVSQTRLEWVLCDVGILLAGGVTVPIYASNTAEQCEFIVRDAGAKMVIVEDAAQRDKLVGAARPAVHGRAPDPADGRSARRPDAAAGGGRARAVAVRAVAGGAARGGTAVGRRAPGRAGRARRDGRRPNRCSRSSTPRGRPGVPKGVVLTHDNLIAGVCSAIRAMQIVDARRAVPVPAARARARARARVGARSRSAARRRSRAGTAQIKEDLVAMRPTFMAGVPRIFEKFYAGVKAALEQGSGLKRKIAAWALRVGRGARGGACAPGSRRGGFAYWLADKLVFSKLRARLGLDRCALPDLGRRAAGRGDRRVLPSARAS